MKDGYLFIILSIIVLFFFACTRRKNDDMTHLVKEWEKKKLFSQIIYILHYMERILFNIRLICNIQFLAMWIRLDVSVVNCNCLCGGSLYIGWIQLIQERFLYYCFYIQKVK